MNRNIITNKKGNIMINKIFASIIILGFSSFLISGEVVKVSNKEKKKIEKVKSEKKITTVKEKRNISKIKPSKINSDKEHQIKLLRKEFESRQMKIEQQYRSEVKNLNSKKERDLEALKREIKKRTEQIRNS